MKKLSVLLLFLAVAISAEDKTPYPMAAFGNIFNTPGGVGDFHYNTPYNHWLSDRFEMILNGSSEWRERLRDNDTSAPAIWAGPYASCQEINLYESGNPGLSYNERLKDTAGHWLYVYAKSYLEDSVGMSVESLVVHVADNSVTIDQHGDGLRTAGNLSSLPYQKRRFTYQYWNNTAYDTAFYPMGYVWLANGYCDETADAIASAYYRAFVADPQKIGWPARTWDCYYMDNHARRLSFMAYWDLETSSGGAYPDYLEWVEGDNLVVRQNGGGSVMASQMDYFDRGVMKIDSAIHSRLMSNGHNIRGFANVYANQPEDLALLLPHVAGVTFEAPLDYNLTWGAWRPILESFDTLAHHPDKYAFLEYRGDFLCQNSGWLSDTSRVLMFGYSFFLAARTPRTFFGPHEVHQGDFGGDRRAWQDAFYVDLGEPDSLWRKIDSTGTGDWTDKTMIIYRSYGQNAVILRTGYRSADYVSDYYPVNLHGLFREVDGWTADTSASADSVFYLRPYEGKILIGDNDGVPVLSRLEFSSQVCLIDSLESIAFTIYDDNGLDSLCLCLYRPDGDTILIDTSFSQGVGQYSDTLWYRWRPEDCGFNSLGIWASDKDGHCLSLPEARTVVVVDEITDIGDAVCLINYVFGSGAPPDPDQPGDANCDGVVDLGDPIYIINHVFRNGAPICCPAAKLD